MYFWIYIKNIFIASKVCPKKGEFGNDLRLSLPESTGSHQITEVKQRCTCLELKWVTTKVTVTQDLCDGLNKV